jgi:hypothetical protein
MTDLVSSRPSERALGAVFIGCAAITVVLLATHPGDGPAADFASVLKAEAAQQLQSAIVHGGMLALLAAELATLAVFAVRLGAARAPIVVALTFSAVSLVFLAGALTLDGLVIPEIARRYVAAPVSAQPFGRSSFVLLGAMIRFLMPIGLAAQGVATLAWGLALWRDRPQRVAGGAALLLGAVLLASLVATASATNPFVVMGGFAGQALWLLLLGASLLRGARKPYASSGVLAEAA